jgi:hypothetical protein
MNWLEYVLRCPGDPMRHRCIERAANHPTDNRNKFGKIYKTSSARLGDEPKTYRLIDVAEGCTGNLHDQAGRELRGEADAEFLLNFR